MPSALRKLQLIRGTRKVSSPQDTIAQAIENEILRFSQQLKHPTKAKFRRCFNCHEPFNPSRDNNYYCSDECQRNSHYVRFNVHSIRTGK